MTFTRSYAVVEVPAFVYNKMRDILEKAGYMHLIMDNNDVLMEGIAVRKALDKRKLGGIARAKALSPERRREIGKMGAEARMRNRKLKLDKEAFLKNAKEETK